MKFYENYEISNQLRKRHLITPKLLMTAVVTKHGSNRDDQLVMVVLIGFNCLLKSAPLSDDIICVGETKSE